MSEFILKLYVYSNNALLRFNSKLLSQGANPRVKADPENPERRRKRTKKPKGQPLTAKQNLEDLSNESMSNPANLEQARLN